MATPPDETRLDLSFLLNQAAYALEARLGGVLAELGLSAREYCLLMKADEAPRTQAQVAELAGLDKTTMVVTLDRLEQAGLVERRVSDVDRRAKVIAVTPRGEGLYRDAQLLVDELIVDTLAPLDRTTRNGLVKGLTQLTSGEGPLAVPSHVAPMRRKQARPHLAAGPSGDRR